MAHAADKTSPKKPKLVRDSFTIPKNEYAAIDALKSRAIALGTSVKKSELLRAGLVALQGLSDAAYKAALSAVPTLKTGRPAGDGADKPAPAKPVKKKAPAKSAAPAPADKVADKAVGKAAGKDKGAAQVSARKPAARKPVARKAASPAKKPAARKPRA
ncbi:MAG: hypothetical protein ACO1OR_13415 [Hydrogenophaga sp.]|jgi:hypothetical protein|uniref:hypothetical protein n=1 Tax=Hydrogenophaga intermedia TaxID=65786 RepID=UPI002043482A|nr:hypothetical protein [Hydrogenophaga intermedia]MCM3563221.1 hypothetical protein [Hydrogenophaga intermedia]